MGGMSLFKRRLVQFVAASAAGLGGFALGCSLGWSASAIGILDMEHGFGTFENNLIGAALPAGASVGVIAVPFLIDFIGRKWTMLALTPFFLAGWAFIVFGASNLIACTIGRLLTGACGGMFCVAAPMYSAEISEKEIRGALGVLFQLLLVFGILYSYTTGYLEHLVWMSVMCGCAPILFASIMFFMPESPLFYLLKSRDEDARKSMKFFRGEGFDVEPELNAFKVSDTHFWYFVKSSRVTKRISRVAKGNHRRYKRAKADLRGVLQPAHDARPPSRIRIDGGPTDVRHQRGDFLRQVDLRMGRYGHGPADADGGGGPCPSGSMFDISFIDRSRRKKTVDDNFGMSYGCVSSGFSCVLYEPRRKSIFCMVTACLNLRIYPCLLFGCRSDSVGLHGGDLPDKTERSSIVKRRLLELVPRVPGDCIFWQPQRSSRVFSYIFLLRGDMCHKRGPHNDFYGGNEGQDFRRDSESIRTIK